MQNTTIEKKIYLSGGGSEKQSFSLDKFFFDAIPKNGKFLYVPIALRGHRLYPTAHIWMRSVVDLHNRKDVTFETMDDPSKYSHADLSVFSGIYIGGGNTWGLIKEFKESGFSEVLIEYHNNGGVVYGGSAGAIILGKRIDTNEDQNKVNVTDMSGFDILNGYSIACHFKGEQEERFKLWAKEKAWPIICLTEETGIMVSESTLCCKGTLPCVVYYPDSSIKHIAPDESMSL